MENFRNHDVSLSSSAFNQIDAYLIAAMQQSECKIGGSGGASDLSKPPHSNILNQCCLQVLHYFNLIFVVMLFNDCYSFVLNLFYWSYKRVPRYVITINL